jgi:hypothetical protein
VLETLIEIIPAFDAHWKGEDIYKEEDGSFTPHGLMGSFLEYYQYNYEKLSLRTLSSLCIEFEKVVSADPTDQDPVANAICTMFLELLVDTNPGNKIEPLLGKSCKEYWNCYKL